MSPHPGVFAIIAGDLIALPFNKNVGLSIKKNPKYFSSNDFSQEALSLLEEYCRSYPQVVEVLEYQIETGVRISNSFDAQNIDQDVIDRASKFRTTKVERQKPTLNANSSVYIPSQRVSTFVRPLSPTIPPYYPHYMTSYPTIFYDQQPVYHPSLYINQTIDLNEEDASTSNLDQQKKKKKRRRKKKSQTSSGDNQARPYLQALLNQPNPSAEVEVVLKQDPPSSKNKNNLIKLKKKKTKVFKGRTKPTKGKQRVTPKKKRLSKLKKVIVNERQKAVTKKESEWITDDEHETEPKIERMEIREYVDQPLDEKLDSVVYQLLSKLIKCQQKLKQREPLKYKQKERLVMGLRQVLRGVRSGKITNVVMAPNIEKIEGEDGLDDVVGKIIENANLKNIPIIYALTKRKIGKALGKTIKVSVVGIYRADGAYDELKLALKLSKDAKNGAPSKD